MRSAACRPSVGKSGAVEPEPARDREAELSAVDDADRAERRQPTARRRARASDPGMASVESTPISAITKSMSMSVNPSDCHACTSCARLPPRRRSDNLARIFRQAQFATVLTRRHRHAGDCQPYRIGFAGLASAYAGLTRCKMQHQPQERVLTRSRAPPAKNRRRPQIPRSACSSRARRRPRSHPPKAPASAAIPVGGGRRRQHDVRDRASQQDPGALRPQREDQRDDERRQRVLPRQQHGLEGIAAGEGRRRERRQRRRRADLRQHGVIEDEHVRREVRHAGLHQRRRDHDRGDDVRRRHRHGETEHPDRDGGIDHGQGQRARPPASRSRLPASARDRSA